MDFLIVECFTLTCLVGLLTIYSHFPSILFVLLSIHAFGTFYSSRQNVVKSSKSKSKSIPAEYRYNFHLKPTNDLRFQSSTRAALFNIDGTTCSFNSLLQTFASFDRFYNSLKRDVNSQRNSSLFVEKFLRCLSQIRQSSTIVDPSEFLDEFRRMAPKFFSKTMPIDLCELFQMFVEIFNENFSFSSDIVEQIENSKLSTFSTEQLNRFFDDVEKQVRR